MPPEEYFAGLWEITNCSSVGLSINPRSVRGTTFKLGNTGEVEWKVKHGTFHHPIFKCDTYDVLNAEPYSIGVLRFGVFRGYTIDCRIRSLNISTGTINLNDGCCILSCRKVQWNDALDAVKFPFSLLPALQEGYFSDLIIKASNNKEFNVHLCILKLSAPEINWRGKPTPLSNLPEEVLSAILHFMYAQCLPSNVKEDVVKKIISVASRTPGLEALESTCYLHIRNLKLEKKIISLITDIHMCVLRMSKNFQDKRSKINGKKIKPLDPARFCCGLKSAIQEAAVAGVKFLKFCDIYSKQRSELTKIKDRKILLHVRSKISRILFQFDNFLFTLKESLSKLTSDQKLKVAEFLLPDVESMIDLFLNILVKVRTILEINQKELEDKKRRKWRFLRELKDFSNGIIYLRDLKNITYIIEVISSNCADFHEGKAEFMMMTSETKIMIIAMYLEQIIRELIKEDYPSLADVGVFWLRYQFSIKVGTAKVTELIDKIRDRKDIMQDLLTDLCNFVQRENFTKTLASLGLFESRNATCKNEKSSYLLHQKRSGRTLSTFDSITDLSIYSSEPFLYWWSLAACDLLVFREDSDMVFEVVQSSCSDDAACFDESFIRLTERSLEPEICEMPAHRVIVAARCDWFRRALLSGMQEDINRKIQVRDTSPYLFYLFLNYLYTGKINCAILPVDHILELLRLSDRYEFDALKQVCEIGLKPHLNNESTIFFYYLADRFNANILKNACEEFVSKCPKKEFNNIMGDSLIEILPENLQIKLCEGRITVKPLKSTYSTYSTYV